jgi:hypothetical protein
LGRYTLKIIFRFNGKILKQFMSRLFLIVSVVAVMLIFSSCETYYNISLDSFKQQFAGIDTAQDKVAKSQMDNGILLGNQVTFKTARDTEIMCTDKANKLFVMKNGPTIQIRFTYLNNNKHKRQAVFYFDAIVVTDTTVGGVAAADFPVVMKVIKLNTITKIEVQDSHTTQGPHVL